MMIGEEITRGHIQALSEELASIPRHPGNHRKIVDRERQLAFYERHLERLEGIHRRFLEGRAELLARCDQFSRVQ
jgi:hypothetical protein